MKISELKELEGQNVFFKNPFGQIQEVTVKRIYLASRMVVYSIKNQDFTGFAGEFFKTREDAERK
ncbi:hypothetical protein AM4_148 [Lactococcus phage AM4]|uniref:Uncharacterized protein n=2 Tax=Audreyjarvisvirus AM4 TaxID=2845189 RepID=A0A1W6JKP3_9CAUD|nr:hypothetical protein H1Z35_gp104 [Lactococcus phage AM4]ARM66806.1 hypothetical protein AM4_148 [Lactococcus phage AM4]ARM66903.1 hypothetical protein AM5_050 [Lactococcus phage AM5]